MVNDVLLNKISVVERCIKRIEEVYNQNPTNLSDITKQDSIVLNIQRACEACIDLAMHISATQKFGVPQQSRDAFELLQANNIITKESASNLKAMVGFRNIAVQDYQAINLDILKEIIEHHLDDFTNFITQILTFNQS